MNVKKLTIIAIIIAALTLIVMLVKPYVIDPRVEQNKIIDTLDIMLEDSKSYIESRSYDLALSTCNKAYDLTYKINSEVNRIIYQCNINLHQGVCYINSGGENRDRDEIIKGLELLDRIFQRLTLIEDKVRVEEIKQLKGWATFHKQYAEYILNYVK